MPVGVIIATCTTPATLPATIRTWPKLMVKRGKALTYRVRFKSTDPINALTGVRVDVSLPPQVTVASTSTYPLPNRRNKASGAATVSNGIVTWQNMTIPAKKTRSFKIKVVVAGATPSGTALSFGCVLSQTNASPFGNPYCPMQVQNATVTVR